MNMIHNLPGASWFIRNLTCSLKKSCFLPFAKSQKAVIYLYTNIIPSKASF